MIDNAYAAETAHNALSETDIEYGRLSAYVKMAPHYIKLIKAKEFLKAVGTVAEKESTAYSSEEYVSYISDLNESMVELSLIHILTLPTNREV